MNKCLDCKKIISDKSNRCYSCANKGELNPSWKGDKVGYYWLHSWIKQHKPKIDLCENCGKDKPYDLANISGEYKRDINDYRWLCRKCHMNEDGRLNKIKKTQFKEGIDTTIATIKSNQYFKNKRDKIKPQINKLFKIGLNITDISKKVGICRYTTRKILIEEGLICRQ